MPCERIALEQSQGLLDRIDQRPTQLEQVATRAPSEDEARQRSAGVWPKIGKLAAKLSESERLSALDLRETRLQRRERRRVREHFRRLLQRLVLVDGNKSCRGRPIAGDQHMVAPIPYIVEQAAEVAAQLAHRNGLCHRPS